MDLLLANPVSRVRVPVANALGSLAGLTAAAVVVYVTVLVAVAALDMGSARAAGPRDVRCAAARLRLRRGHVLTGASTGRRGVAIGVGAGFAVVSYFVSLAEITKVLKSSRVLPVFHQASPTSALRGELGTTGLVATALVTVVACAAAAFLFTRRDLST